MEQDEKNITSQDFNDEPVYYCTRCLSLKIRFLDKIENSEYCDECGCSNIETTSIEEWDKMYQDKYGFKFLNKSY